MSDEDNPYAVGKHTSQPEQEPEPEPEPSETTHPALFVGAVILLVVSMLMKILLFRG